MKTKIIISVIAGSFFFFTSCHKQEMKPVVLSKTINVDLKQNESYTYTIPASGDADDIMEVSQQAQHSLTSKITPDATRNTVFEYVPAKDYAGSDEIHVNTIEGPHTEQHNGDHSGGNCQSHGNETETNYIFKINIIQTVSTQP